MAMTIPLWSLLAFATWTLLTLGTGVGISRWSRILTGRARFKDFAEYEVKGPDIHRRGMRAHANCVENLPVFASLVLVSSIAGLDRTAIDVLCVVVVAARLGQTTVHVVFEQTDAVVFFRSMFFNTQWLVMIAIAAVLAASALG